MKYIVKIQGGELGETEFKASDLERAEARARKWVLDGDWSACEQAELVTFTIETHGGGKWTFEQVVGEPVEPACADGQEHDWQSPHELVGGCDDNPGVFGYGGGRLRFEAVCRNCGLYRTRIKATLPGQAPTAPERTTYGQPDAESLAWVAENEE